MDFNTMPCTYWDNTTKISYLQRRIIIYSIMYYERNESCVSDNYYDKLSHQLKDLQEAHIESFNKSEYKYLFEDFDGSTGYYLASRLNDKDKEHLYHLAKHIYTRWKKSGGNILL